MTTDHLALVMPNTHLTNGRTVPPEVVVPVQIANPDPIAVAVVATEVVMDESKTHRAATTTEEQDRHTKGQRDVNLTWENTQRWIALAVTLTSLVISSWLAIKGATESVQTAALVFVFGVANLVIGFYFGRTNHQRVGGVGGDSAGSR